VGEVVLHYGEILEEHDAIVPSVAGAWVGVSISVSAETALFLDYNDALAELAEPDRSISASRAAAEDADVRVIMASGLKSWILTLEGAEGRAVVLPTQIARSRASDWVAGKSIMLCGVKELLNQGLVLFEVED
jgi:hypothetical protein